MRLKNLDLFTRLLRTRPLFTAALFFIAGCTLEHRLNYDLIIWSCAAALLLAAAVLLRKNRRMLCALLVLLMIPVGAARFELAWISQSPVADCSDVLLSGRIADDPYYNEETERSICILEDIFINNEPFNGRLRLYLRGDANLLQQVTLAQHVNCTARLWQGDGASNPEQFSFGNYLRINKLRGYATAKLEETILSGPDYHFSDYNNLFCARLSERIDRLFNNNSAIVKAFILGDRSEIDQEDRENFNKSGAAHLLAISGMHISMLAMLASALLRRVFKRSHSFAITFLFLLGYGWLIGFSPSLLRAVIMFAVYEFAAVAGRFSDAPTRLGFAALLHLLISPMDILSAGFILSYSASAGIVLLSNPLSRLFRCEALLHSNTERGIKSFFNTGLSKGVMRSVITSLAATLATFPAVIYFFGAQPLWSVLVNLAAVPLAMLSYVLSILGLFTGIAPVCTCADNLFGLLTMMVRLFGSMPFSNIRIARLPVWLSLICAVVFLLSSDFSVLPEMLRRFLPLAAVLSMFISNGIAAIELSGNSLIFFDAGQADCAMLRTEGNVYMFDTGDSYTPAADYIAARNFDIDGVFISHPHSDHAGGLESLLEICAPEKIYISANYDILDIDESIRNSLAAAENMGSEIVEVQTGDVIDLSSKSFAKVLAPDAGISDNSANEDSLILHLICDGVSALFTGDMPVRSMPENLPDVDILKVAHHGSSSGVDPRILTELSPSIAVIPVGEGNLYGHPADETVELLNAAGAKVLRTDICGAITIDIADEGTLEISTYNSFGGSE